jgi:ferrochelatase
VTDTSGITNGELVRNATKAAERGPEHVSEPTDYDAILLAGFGGPEGQDDVIPFLRNVTRGRGIPEERLEEVATHYRHFGGVSPINQHNRELKAALEAELERRGIDLPVVWGNRNWDPYMADAVREADRRGFRKLIAVATSAYSSYSSCRQYREDFAMALDETGLADTMQIDKVRQFFDHPGFVQPFIDGVRDALLKARAEIDGLDLSSEIQVLFATHSIPSTDAAKSGPQSRGFDQDGAYAAQHKAVAEVVMAAAEAALELEIPEGGGSTVPWQLVYQSRSGRRSDPCRRHRAARLRERPHGGHVGSRQRGARDQREERLLGRPHADPRHRPELRDGTRRPRARAPRRRAGRRPPARDGSRPLVRRLPPRVLRERPPRLQAGSLGSGALTL